MVKSVMSYSFGLSVLLIFLGLGIETQNGMPENASLYLDTKNKVYISPPCFSGGDFEDHEPGSKLDPNDINSRFTLTIFSKIRALNRESSREEKIHPDQICNNNDGYQEHMKLAEAIFIGHPIISGKRWNLDGSWNW